MKPQPLLRQASTPARRAARGFTLVEILVTVVILSIGLLGIAGLQAATSRYKINSWVRGSTALLFSDFADRVRANPNEAGRPYREGPVVASSYTLQTLWADQAAATPPAPTLSCLTASCTPAERAAYDMAVWLQNVRRQMPSGSAWVTGDRETGINVTLMWLDKQFLGTDNATLDTTAECTASLTGIARTSCCPEAAAVADGVRCLSFSFIP